jgi:MFS family permease
MSGPLSHRERGEKEEMRLLPLFIFWGLWFLNFSTRAILSLTFFPAGLATISKLTPLPERSMATGVIISIGIVFGVGLTPFILGLIADHLSFQVGILWFGILTTLSSFGVRLLEKE